MDKEFFTCEICGLLVSTKFLGYMGAAAVHAQAHKTEAMGKALKYLEDAAKTDPEANKIVAEITAYNEMVEKILQERI